MTETGQLAEHLFELRLLEVPLALRERSRQHGAELLREMELISIGRSAGTVRHELPERLLELAEELERVYGPYVGANTDDLDAALDRGDDTMPEVVYHLPRSSVDLVRHVDDVLREVDDYCRAGQELLTLAPPADVVAYREWVTSQVLGQAAGEAPTPWPVFASRRGVTP
jgi:hypothetical protein